MRERPRLDQDENLEENIINIIKNLRNLLRLKNLKKRQMMPQLKTRNLFRLEK